MMFSFLSRFRLLFGKDSSDPSNDQSSRIEHYKDCILYATPQKEGAQYRLAGRIEKNVDDHMLIRTFVRADLFSSYDDAIECTLRKAHLIIDQSGPSLFSDGEANRRV